MPVRSVKARARQLMAAALLGGAASSAHAQPWPPPLTATPRLVQDGFGSGGSTLPGDGLEYCVPTSTTMSLLYLGNAGFTQIAPANATASDQLNLLRVISGLFGTTPVGGTSSVGKQSGLEIYLAARGFGSPDVANATHLSNANYSYTSFAFPNVAQMAAVSTLSNATQIAVGELAIGWYRETTPGNYTRHSGHGLTLLEVTSVNNTTLPSTGNVVINNPEPRALAPVPDLANYVTQYVTMGVAVGNFAGVDRAAVEITDTQYGFQPPITTKALIQSMDVLTINANMLAANNVTPAPWFVRGVVPIDTNGGTLEVLAPLQDGPQPGGFAKQGAGVLAFVSQATPTVTGNMTVAGGVLRSLNSGLLPLGTGNVTLQAGTLSLAPSLPGSSLSPTLASGAGSRVFYTGGAVLDLATDAVANYSLSLGSFTDGVTPNLVRQDRGTLAIAPSAGLTELGLSTTVSVAGTANNRPNSSFGIVTPSLVGQGSPGSDYAGDFLAYGNSGFAVAAYVSSSSKPINDPSLDAATMYAVVGNQAIASGNTVSVHALKVAGSAVTSAGGTTTLRVGPQTGGEAGVILNGGSLAASVLQFGDAEALIYTSRAGGAISSVIQGTNGVTTFGPGRLTMSGTQTYSGPTTVQAGTLQVVGTLANAAGGVLVNTEATLQVTGTINRDVTVATRGTLLVQGGTLGANATVTIPAGAQLLGAGTIHGTVTLNGQLGAGSSPGLLTFTAPVQAVGPNSILAWSLFDLADDSTSPPGNQPWNTLAFTAQGSTLQLGNASNPLTVILDLGNVPSPNSGNAFWNLPHRFTYASFTESPGNDVRLSTAHFEQGGFALDLSGNATEWAIIYTPIPEPVTVMGLGALVLVLCRRPKNTNSTSAA